mmetsp:Transcript_50943/g.162996  ORF Transcript_50943/g.162996 Transcript_50943/m.162996 type:complete len:276 (-) Transcript_50943:832-1659(-)
MLTPGGGGPCSRALATCIRCSSCFAAQSEHTGTPAPWQAKHWRPLAPRQPLHSPRSTLPFPLQALHASLPRKVPDPLHARHAGLNRPVPEHREHSRKPLPAHRWQLAAAGGRMPHALQSAATDGADAGVALHTCWEHATSYSAWPAPDADASSEAASVSPGGAAHSRGAATRAGCGTGVWQDWKVAADDISVAEGAGLSAAAGAAGAVATPGSLAEAVGEAPDVGRAADGLLSVHTAGATATASGKAGAMEAKVVGSFAAPNDSGTATPGPVGVL